MIWQIPGKTFLIGEYVALQGGPAIVLTTKPCFTVRLNQTKEMTNIHPASPGGRYWQEKAKDEFPDWHLSFYDPYQGKGGLGASSAQFLGAFWAHYFLKNKNYSASELLRFYAQYTWQGKGTPPSGYDLLAQMKAGCVSIFQEKEVVQSQNWPFPHLSFLLFHSNRKLATHTHLAAFKQRPQCASLFAHAKSAYTAFLAAEESGFLDALRAFAERLNALNLVADHTKLMLAQLKTEPDILAAKGCGALGADILLIITKQSEESKIIQGMERQGWPFLAKSADLYLTQPK